jgi:hypothetical protein
MAVQRAAHEHAWAVLGGEPLDQGVDREDRLVVVLVHQVDHHDVPGGRLERVVAAHTGIGEALEQPVGRAELVAGHAVGAGGGRAVALAERV